MTRVSIDVSAVPPEPAGAGIYILEVVARLARFDDLEIVLIARRNDGGRWIEVAPRAEVHAIAPVTRPLRLVWEQTKLPRFLLDTGPDVHFGPHYTIPERTKVPRVATIHDMTFFDHPEWHERTKVLVFRRAIRSAVTGASQLIAVSNDTSQRLKKRFGDELRVTTIPLGVDHERFDTTDDDDRVALDELGVGDRYFAFVGTVEPRKDVASLLTAFDVVAREDEEVTLVIAGGDGWGNSAYEAALAGMEHRDRVLRLGYVESSTVPKLLRQSVAVVYPSLAEGFGLPALEALACGAVLITTNDSPMADVAGDAALLVDAGNRPQLASAMGRVLAGGPEIDGLRLRGPQIASSYTWDATALAHAELFRSRPSRCVT